MNDKFKMKEEEGVEESLEHQIVETLKNQKNLGNVSAELDGVNLEEEEEAFEENTTLEAFEPDQIKPTRFTNVCARFPVLTCCLLFLPIVGICISIAFFPVKIDYGIESFQIQNHPSAERTDAVAMAKLEAANNLKRYYNPNGTNNLSSRKRSFELADQDLNPILFEEGSPQYLQIKRDEIHGTVSMYTLHLIFFTSSNIFQPHFLREIVRVHRQILNTPNYSKYCYMSFEGYCQPAESPLVFFYANLNQLVANNAVRNSPINAH